MLGKLLSPLTTAAPGGVAARDIWQVVMTIISLAGILGVLSDEQVEQLKLLVTNLAGQWPALVAAFGAISVAGMTIYRIFTKSSSDKAAEAAKQIDAKLAPAEKVEIVTKGNAPNIVIPGKPS